MSTPFSYTPPDEQPGTEAAAGSGPSPAPAAGSAPDPEPTGYQPPDVGASAQDSAAGAAGYLPPDVSAPTEPASAGGGYVPPDAGTSQAAPAAGGYVPPEISTAPVAPAPAPKVPEPRTAPAPAPEPVPTPEPSQPEPLPAEEPPSTPKRNPLLVVGAIVVVVVLVGLFVAWKGGAFDPKLSHLPAKAGGYALDASTQKSSATVYDSGTYRAGAGDLYQASIVKNAPDPAIAFGKAAADTRFQQGDVYCIEANKSGNGGTCTILLPTGSGLTVTASTRHSVKDTAKFTADLRAALK